MEPTHWQNQTHKLSNATAAVDKHQSCPYPNCTGMVRFKGLCWNHAPKLCSISYCRNQVSNTHHQGLCKKHYKQQGKNTAMSLTEQELRQEHQQQQQQQQHPQEQEQYILQDTTPLPKTAFPTEDSSQDSNTTRHTSSSSSSTSSSVPQAKVPCDSVYDHVIPTSFAWKANWKKRERPIPTHLNTKFNIMNIVVTTTETPSDSNPTTTHKNTVQLPFIYHQEKKDPPSKYNWKKTNEEEEKEVEEEEDIHANTIRKQNQNTTHGNKGNQWPLSIQDTSHYSFMDPIMPLASYLTQHSHLQAGWHRMVERESRGIPPLVHSRCQLEEWERQLYMTELLLLTGYPNTSLLAWLTPSSPCAIPSSSSSKKKKKSKKNHTWMTRHYYDITHGTIMANLAHAWGRKKGFANKFFTSFCTRRGDMGRAKPIENRMKGNNRVKEQQQEEEDEEDCDGDDDDNDDIENDNDREERTRDKETDSPESKKRRLKLEPKDEDHNCDLTIRQEKGEYR